MADRKSTAPQRHVMVDLETLSTKPGAVIRSIGAVVFDPTTDDLIVSFYENIDRESCEAFGLTVDPETEAWWARQSEEARSALDFEPKPLRDTLIAFAEWFKRYGDGPLWAHGPGFDCALLAAAYRAIGEPLPWYFFNERCTRTIYAAAGVQPDRSKGVHHNALADAATQAVAVCRAYRKLGIAKPWWVRAQARARTWGRLL